jgi:hypothetical protein
MVFNGTIWECRHCPVWRFPDPDPRLSSEDVAKRLGISRTSLYRWIEEGRIPPAPWRESTVTPLVGVVTKRTRKGPPRNPKSLRYTTGRHRIDEVRTKKDGQSTNA